MGCSECKLLRQLKHEQYIEELVGVDVNSVSLNMYQNVVRPLITDFFNCRQRPLVMRLMQGSTTVIICIVNFHSMLKGFSFNAGWVWPSLQAPLRLPFNASFIKAFINC